MKNFYYLEVKNMIPFTTGIVSFISVKNDITYVVSNNYEKIKFDSYNCLPL